MRRSLYIFKESVNWRHIFLVAFIFLIFGNNANASGGSFGGGDGGSGTPYQIEDCLDLQEVSSYLSSYFILNNNIDCSATTGWNSGSGFLPLGDGTTKFTGVFDGNGKIISDVYISRADMSLYVGLFGYIDGASASVTDVGLVDPNVTGDTRVGGLVGQAWSGATVSSVYVKGGSVSGVSSVGGMIGWRGNGTTANSYASTTVTASGSTAGGFVGAHLSSTAMTNCYSSGNVTANDYVGGFVGETSTTDNVISNCFSTGVVTATTGSPSAKGGFIGRSYANITNSIWHAYSGAPGSCAGTVASGSTAGCTSQASLSYFKDSDNAPMTSWDFDSVWGISGDNNDGYPTLDWQVFDTTNPTVSYLSPADDATTIGVDATFEIAFDEAIATSSGNVVLYKTSDDSTVETISITGALITASSTTALIINPSTTLDSEIEYYFMIDTTAVDDTSGNSYAGITASTTWSFTTLDTPDCSTIDGASTYNAYPTCGVATCNSGYDLSNGACIIPGGVSAHMLVQINNNIQNQNTDVEGSLETIETNQGLTNNKPAEIKIEHEVKIEKKEILPPRVDISKEDPRLSRADKISAKQFRDIIGNIVDEAKIIAKAQIIEVLNHFNINARNRKTDLEYRTFKKYVEPMVNSDLVDKKQENSLVNFVQYGTETTKKLGSVERAGVVSSYKASYKKLPKTNSEWSDCIKIANGRWPTERDDNAEERAKINFKIIYKREPNRVNSRDDAAMVIMSYGLRPSNRNLESEKRAIKFFKAIYGYNPEKPTAWDVVRAIAYSGAIR